MRRSIFYWCVTGFILGIIISSLFHVAFIIILAAFCVSGLLIFVQVFLNKIFSSNNARKYSVLFLVSLVIFFAALANIRYRLFTSDAAEPVLENFVSEQTEYEGVVVSEQDVRETSTRLTVELQKIITEDKSIEIKNTKVLLSDNPYSRLVYGDRISLEGKLEAPENFETDISREFDYISYLAQQKIFYQIKNPAITVLEKHQANKIYELLFSIKSSFIKKIDQLIPFPESRLGAGLVVAGKRSLPKQIQDEFQRSGTMQVIVLSGYNVTIIAQALVTIFSFLPKLYGALCGATGIILFTIIAGGSATIVRASIMALIVIAAQLSKREYDVTRGLVTAGVLMLVLNPMLLFYNPSFQISFLATIGLIHMSPLIKRHFMFVPEKFKLREAIVSTIATQIFVTPFLLYTSGQVSLMSLPANLLLFLVVPVTMLACFIAGMLGFINMFLAFPFAYIAFAFLWYELKIVHVFAAFPFASITLPLFPIWLLLGIYVCFSVMIVRFNKKQESMKPKTAKHILVQDSIKKR